MPGDPSILRSPLSDAERAALAADPFGDMFKIVVDIVREVVVAGGEFHADGEAMLMDDGSAQADLWGANYYPGRPAGSKLEYSALINIRPAQGNRRHAIESESVRNAVRKIAERFVGPA